MPKKSAKKIAKKVAAKKASGEPELKPVSPLLQQLDLVSVRVIASQTNITMQAEVVPKEYQIHVEARCGRVPHERRIAGIVQVEVRNELLPGEEPGKTSIKISLTLQCDFSVESVPTQEQIADDDVTAISNIAMLTCWPYARQFVQATAASMGIAPITLPFMRSSPLPGMPPSIAKVKAD